MRNIDRSLDWTDKKTWCWPEKDEKLAHGIFKHVDDIPYFVKHCDKLDICIQAGGATGVWPLRYAQYFKKVYTFEPLTENWQCLKENTKFVDNIILMNFALYNKSARGYMTPEVGKPDNYGAFHFEEGDGDVGTVAIDSLKLKPDLIQLDIEGGEYHALLGAEHTLSCKPVVILEVKPLEHLETDFLLAKKYLQKMGYKQVDARHRDIVFKCLN